MKDIRPIVKADDKPEPIEVMEKSIVSISEGIKKLRTSRLNDKALFLLIQHACPRNGYYKMIRIIDIKNVIEGIESLEKIYLKKI